MNLRTPLMSLLAMGLALSPSQALACRVGHDQHIFDEAPAPTVLPAAEVLRVRFSTAPQALRKWPKTSPNPDGGPFDYSLIGVARVDDGSARGQTIPVYAVVTSCSAFWVTTLGKAGPSVEGNYYLIGRVQSDRDGRRFLAGGNHNGRWHQ